MSSHMVNTRPTSLARSRCTSLAREQFGASWGGDPDGGGAGGEEDEEPALCLVPDEARPRHSRSSSPSPTCTCPSPLPTAAESPQRLQTSPSKARCGSCKIRFATSAGPQSPLRCAGAASTKAGASRPASRAVSPGPGSDGSPTTAGAGGSPGGGEAWAPHKFAAAATAVMAAGAMARTMGVTLEVPEARTAEEEAEATLGAAAAMAASHKWKVAPYPTRFVLDQDQPEGYAMLDALWADAARRADRGEPIEALMAPGPGPGRPTSSCRRTAALPPGAATAFTPGSWAAALRARNASGPHGGAAAPGSNGSNGQAVVQPPPTANGEGPALRSERRTSATGGLAPTHASASPFAAAPSPASPGPAWAIAGLPQRLGPAAFRREPFGPYDPTSPSGPHSDQTPDQTSGTAGNGNGNGNGGVGPGRARRLSDGVGARGWAPVPGTLPGCGPALAPARQRRHSALEGPAAAFAAAAMAAEAEAEDRDQEQDQSQTAVHHHQALPLLGRPGPGGSRPATPLPLPLPFPDPSGGSSGGSSFDSLQSGDGARAGGAARPCKRPGLVAAAGRFFYRQGTRSTLGRRNAVVPAAAAALAACEGDWAAAAEAEDGTASGGGPRSPVPKGRFATALAHSAGSVSAATGVAGGAGLRAWGQAAHAQPPPQQQPLQRIRPPALVIPLSPGAARSCNSGPVTVPALQLSPGHHTHSVAGSFGGAGGGSTILRRRSSYAAAAPFHSSGAVPAGDPGEYGSPLAALYGNCNDEYDSGPESVNGLTDPCGLGLGSAARSTCDGSDGIGLRCTLSALPASALVDADGCPVSPPLQLMCRVAHTPPHPAPPQEWLVGVADNTVAAAATRVAAAQRALRCDEPAGAAAAALGFGTGYSHHLVPVAYPGARGPSTNTDFSSAPYTRPQSPSPQQQQQRQLRAPAGSGVALIRPASPSGPEPAAAEALGSGRRRSLDAGAPKPSPHASVGSAPLRKDAMALDLDLGLVDPDFDDAAANALPGMTTDLRGSTAPLHSSVGLGGGCGAPGSRSVGELEERGPGLCDSDEEGEGEGAPPEPCRRPLCMLERKDCSTCSFYVRDGEGEAAQEGSAEGCGNTGALAACGLHEAQGQGVSPRSRLAPSPLQTARPPAQPPPPRWAPHHRFRPHDAPEGQAPRMAQCRTACATHSARLSSTVAAAAADAAPPAPLSADHACDCRAQRHPGSLQALPPQAPPHQPHPHHHHARFHQFHGAPAGSPAGGGVGASGACSDADCGSGAASSGAHVLSAPAALEGQTSHPAAAWGDPEPETLEPSRPAAGPSTNAVAVAKCGAVPVGAGVPPGGMHRTARQAPQAAPRRQLLEGHREGWRVEVGVAGSGAAEKETISDRIRKALTFLRSNR
ncbi:hypothetical protein HYH03_003253 [Edaphochlamys debaryana]|uniref:Uncharacterized protein n=1 Tax=Edaphochlamys debaryana TaxID=47281 RepID=A0A835YI53_9CHLO|nr:hypothetical protein HYH03_003253 [Edaphochlamys debaryana]|eukprot:KAG2499070.1 hypothetical protein HYH03_003253 [Edaphochlamys debaryana]